MLSKTSVLTPHTNPREVSSVISTLSRKDGGTEMFRNTPKVSRG